MSEGMLLDEWFSRYLSGESPHNEPVKLRSIRESGVAAILPIALCSI